MALFGKRRDINFFRKVNKELLNNVIDIKILLFPLDYNEMTTNVYGETQKKYYKEPIKINCLLQSDQPNSSIEETGFNVRQNIVVKFLRDELIEKEIFPEVGDIIYWNDFYYEIENRYENQIYMKRNPQTNLIQNPLSFGWNVSIIYNAHLIERNKIGLEYILPIN